MTTRKFMLLLFALSASSALAADVHIYCSATNTVNGDGSLENPYRSLSSLPWNAIASEIGNGNAVYVCLQRGSIFRETLTIGAGGSSAADLVFEPYDGPLSTNNPVLAGDDAVVDLGVYAGGAGTTWSGTVPGLVYNVFVDGVRLSQGSGAGTLNDHEWYWSANVLYIRWDSGNPENYGTVEVSKRAATVSSTGYGYINFRGVDMRRAGGRGAYFVSGSHVELDGCTISEGGVLLDLNNVTDFVARSCVFEDAYDGNNGMKIEGAASSFAFYYCLFHNFLQGPGVSIFAGPGGTFVNCTFVGCISYFISNTSAAAHLSAINCVFSGIDTGPLGGGRESISSGAGVFDITNCLVMACGKNPRKRLAGVTEHGTVWGEPQYRRTRHPAIIAFGRDDSGNLNEALAVSGLLKTYGWGLTYAFTTGGGGLPVDDVVKNKLRTIVANGGEVTCHGREHVDLTDPRAFTLSYSGPGSTATVSIANSNLVTKVDGVVDRTLDIGNYSSLEDLVAALNSGSYSCTWPQAPGRIPYRVPPWLLANVTAQDILNTPFTNLLNYAAFLNREIVFAKAELESTIGNGYVVTGLTPPYGAYDGTVLTNIQNAGYIHARTVTFEPTPGYLLAKNNTYQLAITPDISGTSAVLPFENSSSDTSDAGNHFTASNVVYSSAEKYRGAFSAYFNGTSASVSRPSNASFDFSSGDWLFCAQVYPTALGGQQTLFFNGSSDANYLRIYLDNDGSVHVEARTNGMTVIDFSSDQVTLTNGGWTKVSIQETYDRWYIRINNVVVGLTNSTARLADFGNSVYIGCSYGFAAGAREKFYEGYLDDVDIADHTYYYTQSTLDQMCEEGCFAEMYGHSESTSALEIWRLMFDAVRDYSGRIMVMTEGAAANYIRTNGLLSPLDGQTVIRTNSWVPSADYRLRSTSPCRGAGLSAPLVGQTNLCDLDGNQITGPNGELLRSEIDLGAYAYQPAKPTIFDARWSNDHFQFSVSTQMGITYDIQFKQGFTDPAWTTFQTIVGNGDAMKISDSGPVRQQRLYRVLVR